MTELLVAHNYFLEYDPAERDAVRPWAPLSPLYAAQALRSQGHDLAFWDATFARNEGEFDSAVRHFRPRVVVIMADAFNVPQKMCLRRLRQAAFTMMKSAREAGAVILVAGPDAASHPLTWLEGGADYLVAGEAEAVLCDAIPRILKGNSARDVRGLCYRNGAGQVEEGEERARLTTLSDLGHPARDLIDMPRYLDAWKRKHGFSMANLVASRGCPFPCNWCAKPVYGRRYTTRSPEDVVAEALDLKQRYGVDRLWYADEVFGLEKKWLARFRQASQESHAVIPFEALSRVDLIDARSAEDLAASGCVSLWMGAESGSQRILDAMDKGTRVEEIRTAREALGKVGIEVGFFLQFGYPGEAMEDIDKTLRMVREVLPDRIGISVSYPLPGTPFYEKVRSQARVSRGWQVSMENELLHVSTYSPQFYKVLRRLVHKEFALQRNRKEFVKEWKSRGTGDWSVLRRVPRMAWQEGARRALKARLWGLARRGQEKDLEGPEASTLTNP